MLGIDLGTFVKGSIALIALFIVVSNGQNFAAISKAVAGGGGTLINALQGKQVSSF
jgi:hypothetical protein